MSLYNLLYSNHYKIIVILIIHIVIKSSIFSFRKNESSFLNNESFHSLELTDYHHAQMINYIIICHIIRMCYYLYKVLVPKRFLYRGLIICLWKATIFFSTVYCRLLDDPIQREQPSDSSEVQLSPQKCNESYCIGALAKSILEEHHHSLYFPENCNLDLSSFRLLKV